MAVLVEEYRRENAGNGTVIDVNDVDNELTITLNGDLVTQIKGPAGDADRYNKNITSMPQRWCKRISS